MRMPDAALSNAPARCSSRLSPSTILSLSSSRKTLLISGSNADNPGAAVLELGNHVVSAAAPGIVHSGDTMNKIDSMDKSCLTLHTVTAIITVWSEGFL